MFNKVYNKILVLAIGLFLFSCDSPGNKASKLFDEAKQFKQSADHALDLSTFTKSARLYKKSLLKLKEIEQEYSSTAIGRSLLQGDTIIDGKSYADYQQDISRMISLSEAEKDLYDELKATDFLDEMRKRVDQYQQSGY